MKPLLLTLGILSMAPVAFAAPCSKSRPVRPCTPPAGDATNTAKNEILDLIRDAQDLDLLVSDLETKFRAIRHDEAASDEKKFEYLEAYRAKKQAQDQLLNKAIEKTSDLYQVRPKHSGPIIIGVPDEPHKKWMSGLSASWAPRVVDPGPGDKLSVRIDGSDGRPHFSGGKNFDPTKPKGKEAITLADGRTLIIKRTLYLALAKKNPGYLARVLYHESRHFDHLSRPDGAGGNRSWAVPDEEERAAYADDVAMARVFGLKESETKALKKTLKEYDDAIRAGIPATDDHLSPQQQEIWQEHYEKIQINLEEEYTDLKRKVEAQRAEQKEIQRSAREAQEREERERQEREREEEKRRQENTWAEIDAAAGRCAYSVSFQNNTGAFLGFQNESGYLFFRSPYKTPLDLNDIKLALMVGRACTGVKSNTRLTSPEACNAAAPLMQTQATRSDFPAKLDYMFGPRGSSRDPCVTFLFDQAASITDAASFDRTVKKYQQKVENERREHDKNWKIKEPEKSSPDRTTPPRNADPGCSVENGVNGCPR